MVTVIFSLSLSPHTHTHTQTHTHIRLLYSFFALIFRTANTERRNEFKEGFFNKKICFFFQLQKEIEIGFNQIFLYWSSVNI